MENRQKVIFKIGEEIILEESVDTLISDIEGMKRIIAEECECNIADIEVIIENSPIDISEDIDVGFYGMIYWKDCFPIPLIGIQCDLIEGSVAHLEAITKGTLNEYLKFV